MAKSTADTSIILHDTKTVYNQFSCFAGTKALGLIRHSPGRIPTNNNMRFQKEQIKAIAQQYDIELVRTETLNVSSRLKPYGLSFVSQELREFYESSLYLNRIIITSEPTRICRGKSGRENDALDDMSVIVKQMQEQYRIEHPLCLLFWHNGTLDDRLREGQKRAKERGEHIGCPKTDKRLIEFVRRNQYLSCRDIAKLSEQEYKKGKLPKTLGKSTASTILKELSNK